MDAASTTLTVNAPLGVPTWLEIDWNQANRQVKKIQLRIVNAVKANRWRLVRNLQRLLTRSLSAKQLAVKRVVENNGNRTPGIDGIAWRSSQAKSKAILSLTVKRYKAQPLKRIYIPKANGKRRPLGIPTMKDRALQSLYKLALEPIAETKADKHSYGFRPNRSTADAIAQCFNLLAPPHRAEWVLECDIQGCFDTIHHAWLLKHIPMNKRILKQWLTAGFIFNEIWHPTEAGTPQGGIISPVLMNLTLDGLSHQLHSLFGIPSSKQSNQNKVHLVRYADDFIITGISPVLLETTVKPAVISFLEERGLKLAKEKTNIVSIHQGFDFLGQTIRKYRNKILLIIPSKESQKAYRKKLREKISKLKTAPQSKVINTLNPIITGWGNYHKHVVAKEVFSNLDNWLWKRLWKWSYQRHPMKRKTWVAQKYFQTIGSRKWEFSSMTISKGKPIFRSLRRLAAIPIRRHIKIKGEANPFDLSFEYYFEQRSVAQMKSITQKRVISLYGRQKGKCLMCHLRITPESRWNIHHKLEKAKGGTEKLDNLVLLHPHCHRQLHGRIAAGLIIPENLSQA